MELTEITTLLYVFPWFLIKFVIFYIVNSALQKKWQLNDGNSLFLTKSRKPPIIAQYDAQRRRIKRLIVLLFLRRHEQVSRNVSTSRNAQPPSGKKKFSRKSKF